MGGVTLISDPNHELVTFNHVSVESADRSFRVVRIFEPNSASTVILKINKTHATRIFK